MMKLVFGIAYEYSTLTVSVVAMIYGYIAEIERVVIVVFMNESLNHSFKNTDSFINVFFSIPFMNIAAVCVARKCAVPNSAVTLFGTAFVGKKKQM